MQLQLRTSSPRPRGRSIPRPAPRHGVSACRTAPSRTGGCRTGPARRRRARCARGTAPARADHARLERRPARAAPRPSAHVFDPRPDRSDASSWRLGAQDEQALRAAIDAGRSRAHGFLHGASLRRRQASAVKTPQDAASGAAQAPSARSPIGKSRWARDQYSSPEPPSNAAAVRSAGRPRRRCACPSRNICAQWRAIGIGYARDEARHARGNRAAIAPAPARRGLLILEVKAGADGARPHPSSWVVRGKPVLDGDSRISQVSRASSSRLVMFAQRGASRRSSTVALPGEPASARARHLARGSAAPLLPALG